MSCHVRQILHWGPLVASSLGTRLIFRIKNMSNIGVSLCLGMCHVCHCQSLKDGSEERRKKSQAAVVAGNVAWIAFEVIGASTVLSWRNLRAFAWGNSKANPDFQVPSFSTEYLGCALSWNASSGLPEEHLLFEHLFHFHDVSMHLGSLNPLMRCHEQR